MKKNISKLAIAGAVMGAAVLVICKEVKNNDKISERIKNKKIEVKNLEEIKKKCNEKLNKKVNKKFIDKLDKINDLRSSFFNKQSSTSVVFGNPTYNVYGSERSDDDE